MRTVAPSETKKCALGEDFSQKTFDLPQFGHFSGKSPSAPCPAARSQAKKWHKQRHAEWRKDRKCNGKTGKTPATRLKDNLMVLHLRAGTTRIGADGETRTPKPKHWLLRPACLPIPPHPHFVLLCTTCSLILTTREQSGYLGLKEQALGKAKAAFYWISQRNAAFFMTAPWRRLLAFFCGHRRRLLDPEPGRIQGRQEQ